jgi:glycosyltransferase involved in cell wall biosynthesis
MDDSDRPYLSVVIASRNDGYTGDMLRRLQVCISAFVAQMERVDLPSELVLVDWNPPTGKDLWSALSWPSVVRRCTIRVINVPRRLHVLSPFADRLPILIHRARNVGVRRARGEFVLPTSADILLSNELAEWFGRRELDPTLMYRLARRDVPDKALQYNSHDKRLIYCHRHVRQVHERGPSHRMAGLPHLFTNAAGDFTLLSRDLYFRLHGIPEERDFHSMHFDSVFCFMAHAAGAQETELMDPLRIYHIDHGAPSWRPSASWLERAVTRLPIRGRTSTRLIELARRIAPPRSAMDRRGIPHLDCSTVAGQAQYEALIRSLIREPGAFRYNDADWGLGRYSLEERVLGPAPAMS